MRAPDRTALADYYARRAASYEQVYAKPERQADLRELEAMLPMLFAGRHVLEVACGTGWWTGHGARDCASWLATDVNDEVLAIARTKPLPAGKVRLARIDAERFDGLAPRSFDGAFAGFWWSHLPRSRLAGWLERLHALVAPGGRVAFLDNRFVQGSSTPIACTDEAGDTWQRRSLPDGSTHEVLKNFPTRDEALAVLGPRARAPRWVETTYYWLLTYELA